MTGRLRRALDDDLPAIVALDRGASPVFADDAAYRSYLGDDGLLLVVGTAPDIAGFIALRCVLDEAEIINIAVAPASRRRGLGTALLTQASQWLVEGGIRRVLLDVRESNAAARALYRRCGFREDGRRPAYYPPPAGADVREAAILMSRDLKAIDGDAYEDTRGR